MRDTGVWKRYDPRYVFQRKWEKEQAHAAAGLIVVSDLYLETLALQLQLPLHKIKLARNTVTAKGFRFSAPERVKKRTLLGFSEGSVVGIYVGKYGDLYYKEEAFVIYKYCFETIPDFRLIILSPQPKQEIEGFLQQEDIDLRKVFVATVPHAEVPQYLSAADFAFATIKSYPSARFCSPVKVGEYWANGLPVLLTEGVGDDSDIIQKEGGGATFNLQQEGSLEQALSKIQQMLEDPSHRQNIPKLAEKHRSPDRVREAYAYFLGQEKEADA
ncbi:glycosyltransferase family protein [Pontibacter sp. CAU 1760]